MDKSRSELFRELLEHAHEPIVVEGVKDEKTLRSLGFTRITRINDGTSLLTTVEKLQEYERVIILTDLDRQGRILRKKLLKLFGPYGIHEIRRPREILAQLHVSHVEGLKKAGLP